MYVWEHSILNLIIIGSVRTTKIHRWSNSGSQLVCSTATTNTVVLNENKNLCIVVSASRLNVKEALLLTAKHRSDNFDTCQYKQKSLQTGIGIRLTRVKLYKFWGIVWNRMDSFYFGFLSIIWYKKIPFAKNRKLSTFALETKSSYAIVSQSASILHESS